MNRASRREAQQSQRRVLANAARANARSGALVYKEGYEHIGCGGEVERPNKVGLGAYCTLCERHIPMRESRKVKA